ncbi:MAG: hypothetical protein WDN30_11590 [Pararobbsia sp.]
MRALLDRADHLQARVHALRNDPATREHVEPALEQTGSCARCPPTT